MSAVYLNNWHVPGELQFIVNPMRKCFSTGSRGSAPGGVWDVPTCSLPLAAAGGTKNLHMALANSMPTTRVVTLLLCVRHAVPAARLSQSSLVPARLPSESPQSLSENFLIPVGWLSPQ